MALERRHPTPRAQRILSEIESLTVRDVVWLTRELRRLLDSGDEPDPTGVREPRRPPPPADADAIEFGRRLADEHGW